MPHNDTGTYLGLCIAAAFARGGQGVSSRLSLASVFAMVLPARDTQASAYMGVCQNYGPFLGPEYIRLCRWGSWVELMTTLLTKHPGHVGGCQIHGPILGSRNTRCRIIQRTPKGTIILTTSFRLGLLSKQGNHGFPKYPALYKPH